MKLIRSIKSTELEQSTYDGNARHAKVENYPRKFPRPRCLLYRPIRGIEIYSLHYQLSRDKVDTGKISKEIDKVYKLHRTRAKYVRKSRKLSTKDRRLRCLLYRLIRGILIYSLCYQLPTKSADTGERSIEVDRSHEYVHSAENMRMSDHNRIPV